MAASTIKRRSNPPDPPGEPASSPTAPSTTPTPTATASTAAPSSSAQRKRTPASVSSAILAFATLCVLYFALQNTDYAPYLPGSRLVDTASRVLEGLLGSNDEIEGHADFGDGRKRTCPPLFATPSSGALYYVNVNLGNGG